MPRILASFALLCFALAHAAIQDPASAAEGDGRVQDEIKQLEQQRNEALLKGDAEVIERMTSDDYTFINQRGEMRTKTEILAGFKTGTYKYDSRQIFDLQVRVYGDTAVVTGRAVQQGVENRKDYGGENRFTRVYVKRGGRWVSVALQVTLVANHGDNP